MSFLSFRKPISGVGLSIALTLLALCSLGCNSDSVTIATMNHPAGKIYIPNQADQTITVLNGADLVELKTFATPVEEPHFVEFSPDGLYYYIVGRQVAGTIAKYKTSNDSLVAHITVEGVVFPTAFAISSGNDTLYLTDFTLGPGHMHRYDVAGDNFVWIDSTTQAGHQTHDVTISPDGKYVVSAGFSSDDITILNTVTGDVTPLTLDSAKTQFNSVANNYGAYGVEIDHNSQVAILACRKNVDQIRLIDLANKTILDSILSPVVNGANPGSEGPNYMALAPDNNTLFVTNLKDNSMTVYRISTREVLAHIPFATPKAFGIDISDDGTRVYVTCTNVRPAAGMLYVIDAATFEKLDSVTVGSEPFGLSWQSE